MKTEREIIEEIRKSLVDIELRLQPRNRMCANIRALTWVLEES